MTLAPLARQALAGTAAAGAFLGLYAGAALAWWAAVLAGLAVYSAVLLIVEAERPAAPALASGVTDAELREAIDRLTDAAARVRAAALKARGPEKTTFRRLAELLEAIRGHHIADRRDFRHTRPFIRTQLERMVGAIEGYVDLDARARGANRERLEDVRERIEGFVPALEKIDQACLENDFVALEVQVEVLGEQLERR